MNTSTMEVKPEGRFAQALTARMREKNVEIRDLAQHTKLTYEHIRKLTKGVAYPSEFALKKVCDVLGLDYDKMNELAVADKIENKWGGIPHALLGKHPELSLIQPWWDMLNDDQKSMLRLQIKSIAESNQKHEARRIV